VLKSGLSRTSGLIGLACCAATAVVGCTSGTRGNVDVAPPPSLSSLIGERVGGVVRLSPPGPSYLRCLGSGLPRSTTAPGMRGAGYLAPPPPGRLALYAAKPSLPRSVLDRLLKNLACKLLPALLEADVFSTAFVVEEGASLAAASSRRPGWRGRPVAVAVVVVAACGRGLASSLVLRSDSTLASPPRASLAAAGILLLGSGTGFRRLLSAKSKVALDPGCCLLDEPAAFPKRA